MTTSMTDQNAPNQSAPKMRGALADGLTLVRVFIAPIVVIAIIFGWPATGFAILASVLFAIGALTDLFDDMIGGSKHAAFRAFGWFDDIADGVLIGSALLAMGFVLYKNGLINWTYTVPVAVYIARDILVALIKGFDFQKNGMPKNYLGDIKNALAMLGVSLMIASPWLQQFIDRIRAGDDPEKLMAIYNNASPWAWVAGHGLFCIATILTVITAIGYIMNKPENEP